MIRPTSSTPSTPGGLPKPGRAFALVVLSASLWGAGCSTSVSTQRIVVPVSPAAGASPEAAACARRCLDWLRGQHAADCLLDCPGARLAFEASCDSLDVPRYAWCVTLRRETVAPDMKAIGAVIEGAAEVAHAVDEARHATSSARESPSTPSRIESSSASGMSAASAPSHSQGSKPDAPPARTKAAPSRKPERKAARPTPR